MSPKNNWSRLLRSSAIESDSYSLRSLWRQYLSLVSLFLPPRFIAFVERRRRTLVLLGVCTAVELLLLGIAWFLYSK